MDEGFLLYAFLIIPLELVIAADPIPNACRDPIELNPLESEAPLVGVLVERRILLLHIAGHFCKEKTNEHAAEEHLEDADGLL